MSSSTSTPTDIADATRQDIFTSLPSALVQRVLTTAPFVPTAGAYNLRDVGLSGADIGATPLLKLSRLYRSAALSEIQPQGIEQLTHLGITKIVDLRSEKERQRTPTPPMEGIQNVWLPPAQEPARMDLASFGGSPSQVHDAFVSMYQDILVTHVPIYRYVFQHIKDSSQDSQDSHQPPDGPSSSLLFHCQGGKDRTGVLAALILSVAGVDDQVIAHDYTLTRLGLEPAREFLLKAASSVPSPRFDSPTDQLDSDNVKEASAPRSADLTASIQQAVTSGKTDDTKLAMLAGICRSDKEVMETFLNVLRERYGGARGYLVTSLGFSEDEVEVIRSQLLV